MKLMTHSSVQPMNIQGGTNRWMGLWKGFLGVDTFSYCFYCAFSVSISVQSQRRVLELYSNELERLCLDGHTHGSVSAASSNKNTTKKTIAAAID